MRSHGLLLALFLIVASCQPALSAPEDFTVSLRSAVPGVSPPAWGDDAAATASSVSTIAASTLTCGLTTHVVVRVDVAAEPSTAVQELEVDLELGAAVAGSGFSAGVTLSRVLSVASNAAASDAAVSGDDGSLVTIRSQELVGGPLFDASGAARTAVTLAIDDLEASETVVAVVEVTVLCSDDSATLAAASGSITATVSEARVVAPGSGVVPLGAATSVTATVTGLSGVQFPGDDAVDMCDAGTPGENSAAEMFNVTVTAEVGGAETQLQLLPFTSTSTAVDWFGYDAGTFSSSPEAELAQKDTMVFTLVETADGLFLALVLDATNDGNDGSVGGLSLTCNSAGCDDATAVVSDDAGEFTGSSGSFSWQAADTDGVMFGPMNACMSLTVQVSGAVVGLNGAQIAASVPGDVGGVELSPQFGVKDTFVLESCSSCSNGGVLTRCGECSCRNGWAGPTCEVCARVCANGGVLDEATCTCSCPTGFIGSECAESCPSTPGFAAEELEDWRRLPILPVIDQSAADDMTLNAAQAFGGGSELVHLTLAADGLNMYVTGGQHAATGSAAYLNTLRRYPDGTLALAQQVSPANLGFTAANVRFGRSVVSPDGKNVYFIVVEDDASPNVYLVVMTRSVPADGSDAAGELSYLNRYAMSDMATTEYVAQGAARMPDIFIEMSPNGEHVYVVGQAAAGVDLSGDGELRPIMYNFELLYTAGTLQDPPVACTEVFEGIERNSNGNIEVIFEPIVSECNTTAGFECVGVQCATRVSDGSLTLVEATQDGLEGFQPSSLLVSDDSRFVYVASLGYEEAAVRTANGGVGLRSRRISVLELDQRTSTLVSRQVAGHWAADTAGAPTSLRVFLSPENRFVYAVTDAESDAANAAREVTVRSRSLVDGRLSGARMRLGDLDRCNPVLTWHPSALCASKKYVWMQSDQVGSATAVRSEVWKWANNDVEDMCPSSPPELARLLRFTFDESTSSTGGLPLVPSGPVACQDDYAYAVTPTGSIEMYHVAPRELQYFVDGPIDDFIMRRDTPLTPIIPSNEGGSIQRYVVLEGDQTGTGMASSSGVARFTQPSEEDEAKGVGRFLPRMDEGGAVLPPGLTLDETTGMITGTPTEFQDRTFYTLRGINRLGNFAQSVFSVTVSPVIPERDCESGPPVLVKQNASSASGFDIGDNGWFWLFWPLLLLLCCLLCLLCWLCRKNRKKEQVIKEVEMTEYVHDHHHIHGIPKDKPEEDDEEDDVEAAAPVMNSFNAAQPMQLRLRPVGEKNMYLFGTTKVQLAVIGNKLVVRVGGGWMDAEEYVQKYAPRECRRMGLDPNHAIMLQHVGDDLQHAEKMVRDNIAGAKKKGQSTDNLLSSRKTSSADDMRF